MGTDPVHYWAGQIIQRLETMMSDDGKVREGSVQSLLRAENDADGQRMMDMGTRGGWCTRVAPAAGHERTRREAGTRRRDGIGDIEGV
jgi:hypothetical protein